MKIKTYNGIEVREMILKDWSDVDNKIIEVYNNGEQNPNTIRIMLGMVKVQDGEHLINAHISALEVSKVLAQYLGQETYTYDSIRL